MMFHATTKENSGGHGNLDIPPYESEILAV